MREIIAQRVEQLGLDLATISKKIGRNHSYLHQFMQYEKPKQLGEDDRRELATGEIQNVNDKANLARAWLRVQDRRRMDRIAAASHRTAKMAMFAAWASAGAAIVTACAAALRWALG